MAKPGDANAITREYFDSILLEMRHIDSILPSTQLQLFGETFDTPVMTAALSHLDSVRQNGMALQGQGAFQSGAVNWAGMGDQKELEDIAATGARTIKIIKPYENNDDIYEKISHAERVGALAVGMDLDHAFDGKGNYDVVEGLAMRPKTSGELRAFIRSTKLPFVIKGVLSERDAMKCLDLGVSGIVVSHHHGIMDYAVPPLQILPKIARIIDGRIPIFVDCGVESGMDVFKALALGATAVSVGRMLMKPLKENGADGVAQAIKEMTGALAGVMARTGYASLAEIDDSCIWHKQ